jgi:hypothetical protein
LVSLPAFLLVGAFFSVKGCGLTSVETAATSNGLSLGSCQSSQIQQIGNMCVCVNLKLLSPKGAGPSTLGGWENALT